MNRNKYNSSFLVAFIFSLLLPALVASCATVPPESIDLSKQVSAGIAKARSAHLSTIDAFYNRLSKDNDSWVVNVYLSRVIATATSDLAAECKKTGDTSTSCNQLNNNDIKRIIAKTIEFRDDMQSALSKNRDDAVHLINEHYADLLSANSGVTALLASAVDVSKATKDSTALASKVTGIKIDTDAIEQALSKYLKDAGTVGAKISDLESNLSEILNKQDKK